MFLSPQIKEVAAPYTSSPDLRRFWEHDIRVARDANRATMSHGHDKRSTVDVEYVSLIFICGLFNTVGENIQNYSFVFLMCFLRHVSGCKLRVHVCNTAVCNN
jgi:hypothetical protein